MNTPLPGFGQPERTEPAVSEVDRLKGLLERRTEALNRTVEELETERARAEHLRSAWQRADKDANMALRLVARVEALIPPDVELIEAGYAVPAGDLLVALEVK